MDINTAKENTGAAQSLPSQTGSGFPKYCGIYFAIYGGFPVILDVLEEGMKVVYADGETDPIYNDTPLDWWMPVPSQPKLLQLWQNL